MADSNKLELVVEVDVNKANASIKTINTGLSSMEHAAARAGAGAASGIDAMTASVIKGATAGMSWRNISKRLGVPVATLIDACRTEKPNS